MVVECQSRIKLRSMRCTYFVNQVMHHVMLQNIRFSVLSALKSLNDKANILLSDIRQLQVITFLTLLFCIMTESIVTCHRTEND